MSNVLTFTPRPTPIAPEVPEPLAGAELRAQIEAGVQAALDLADHYIAVLNGMDGCPDLEDGGDAEPSLAAPESATGSQVVYMRGNDQDREAEAPEAVLPEVAAEPVPEAEILPWRGRGNVIAALGVTILDMVGDRRRETNCCLNAKACLLVVR
ncbi:hypothetical protein [Methylobacterium sp. J-070]|uniref:hypothetical protein n=1 Tax=Methylobacterium sp. J-070 TaxID=2836650 RepID=UPI001FB9558B|nr:hypothetical protein [Methylobacterium sp. J-070]MCJ2049092.1 hypothetical protein [Methylobacterium sp. J-070]